MTKDVDLNPIERIKKGLDITAEAVGGTLGPKGRNAFIGDPAIPRITNDGKTIADSITLTDKFEELGAWLVKNTAAQTNDDAGDGTTTTTVLLQAIVNEALKRPENSMDIAQSLKAALPGVLQAIVSKSRPVENLEQVAFISSEDADLAKIIAELVSKVGATGTVLLEESNDGKTSYEFVNGYEAHTGFLSPHFITEGDRAEYRDIPVFCTEKKISNVGDVKRLFEQMAQKQMRRIVIVCEDIDNTMLGVFVQNKIMRALDILVVKATGPLLADIAAAVGATAVSDSTGVTFENFDYDSHLGMAQKVVSTEKKTVFVSNAKSALEQATLLENFAEQNPNKWEAKKYKERAAKLRGGIAVIRVGSPTSVDMYYLKDKAEDAIHATQAALEEGVVEGGGMTLWHIAEEMEDKTVGEQILKKALKMPAKRIIENGGVEWASVLPVVYPDDIIDPAKVERCAVTNAVLNAANFITSHCAIVEHIEKK